MEQRLLEDLVTEAISIYGQDMYYIPRTIGNKDKLYGADDQSRYEQAFFVCMYIKSVDGFSGDGNFMSKFGLEIRDQVVFSISQRVFNEEVGSTTGQVRPNEGDLIFFPLNNKCFQIRYTNKFEMFYQLGALQTWEMTCELFEYSGEVMNTGIPEVDILQSKYSQNVLDWTVLDESGNYLMTEDGDYIVNEKFDMETLDPLANNDEIQIESDKYVDFTERDPFSEAGLF
jgi:hypothetical protein